MKQNKILIAIISATLIISLFSFFSDKAKSVKAGGGGSDVSQCYGLGGAATNTVTYLGPGRATTTYIADCPVNRAEQLDMDFYIGASTTGATLTVERQWSFNGGDWFNETVCTAEANNKAVTCGATSTESYPLNIVGTSSLNRSIGDTSSRHLRINVKGNGASGLNLWMMVSKRESNN